MIVTLRQYVLSKLPISGEDLRFLIVGASGFMINAVMLTVLHGLLKTPLLLAQLASSEVAILSNYLWHNRWTYRGYKHKAPLRRIAHFHMTAWSGSLLGSLVLWSVATYLHVHYLIALCIGAFFGMVWNYLFNRYVVWAREQADV